MATFFFYFKSSQIVVFDQKHDEGYDQRRETASKLFYCFIKPFITSRVIIREELGD